MTDKISEQRDEKGRFRKGMKAWNFKGGEKLKRKYKRFNGKLILKSHFVWLKYNKLTEIPKGYVIHHKDGNSLNDNIKNLILMKDSEHKSLHNKRVGDALIHSQQESVQVGKDKIPFIVIDNKDTTDNKGCGKPLMHELLIGDTWGVCGEECSACGVHLCDKCETTDNPDLCVMCGINEQNEIVKFSANKGLCSECNRKHPVLYSGGSANKGYTNKEVKK